jgi:segregation and condensation protein B
MSANPLISPPIVTADESAVALSRFIETVLFVAEAPVTLLELIEIYTRAYPDQLAPNEEQWNHAFETLRARCQEAGYIYMLQPIAGGWQLLTKLQFAPIARQAIVQREQKKLSRAALETLAIIAYRQPVTKAEVEFIRGVASDYAVQKLLDKQLIEPAGRAELPGKPMLYRTTRHFMEFFGLANLSDLPKLQDLQLDEEALEQSLKEALQRADEPTEAPNASTESPEGE